MKQRAFLFLSVLVVGLAFGILLVKGSLIIKSGSFVREFPLNLFLECLLAGGLFFYAFVCVIRLVIDFPQKFLTKVRDKTKRYESHLTERVLHWVLCPIKDPKLFKETYFFKNEFQGNVLSLFVALQNEDWDAVEVFASHVIQKKKTERLGKMCLAQYYDHMKNYDMALKYFGQVKHDFYHASREEVCLDNLIFREYLKMAEEGKFVPGSMDEKFAAWEKKNEAMATARLSQLFSAQARSEEKQRVFGAHEMQVQKEQMTLLQKKAYAFDPENVEAACYIMRWTDLVDFAQKNEVLIQGFCRNPHFLWIKCLKDLNEEAGLREVFPKLKKKIDKLDRVKLEHLYGMAYLAIKARLKDEADLYWARLDGAVAGKRSPRILTLLEQKEGQERKDHHLWNFGQTANKPFANFLEGESNVRSKGEDQTARGSDSEDCLESLFCQDVFRCSCCQAEFSQQHEFCRNCWTLRSLSWTLRAQ